MSGDGLVDPVLGELFPGSVDTAAVDPADGVDVITLPNSRDPTVVVPRRPRRAAAAVLGAHDSGTSLRRRGRRLALIAAASSGAADLVGHRLVVPYGDGSSLFETLSALVGQPVVLGVHLGPRRANRKPVVQVLDSRGRTLAFVKVSVDDLTGRLLDTEADALTRIAAADLGSVVAPRVIDRVRWRDHDLLVLAPVETTSLRAPAPSLLHRAMLEVHNLNRCGNRAMVDTACWEQARVSLDGLPGDDAGSLRTAIARLQAVGRDVVVPVGAWHGDWSPWNLSSRRGRLVVWDWERFGPEAPLGFDAVHFDLQRRLRRGSPREAVKSTFEALDTLLAPLGIPKTARLWIAVGYLVVIGARYLKDGQAAAGSAIGHLDGWLLPELELSVRRLVGPRSAGELV